MPVARSGDFAQDDPGHRAELEIDRGVCEDTPRKIWIEAVVMGGGQRAARMGTYLDSSQREEAPWFELESSDSVIGGRIWCVGFKISRRVRSLISANANRKNIRTS